MYDVLNLTRREFSLFTNFSINTTATETEIAHILDAMGTTDTIKQLVALRNAASGAYDVVMTLLTGQVMKANSILLGYTGRLFNGKLSLDNKSKRTSGLSCVGLVKDVEREKAYIKMGFTWDTTIKDALEIIKNETQNSDSVFLSTQEYKTNIVLVCNELIKIYENRE